VSGLKSLGHEVHVHDPLADAKEAEHHYSVTLQDDITGGYDCVVGAVAHDQYKNISPEKLINAGGLIADLKAIWPSVANNGKCRYWSL